MGTGKYPEEIVAKVAKAIARTMGGWNDDTSEPNLPDAHREAMESHWRRVNATCLELGREYAIAALDALGLTVTEECGSSTRKPRSLKASGEFGRDLATRLTNGWGLTLERRLILHAETPWEVVDR